jgi:transcriptional regulator with XRE-family HTH domain
MLYLNKKIDKGGSEKMFINKLNYLLESKKLNKKQFSEKSDIPYTTIDGIYKKGYANIKLSTLKKIANFFNVSLGYLIVDEVLDINYGKNKKSDFIISRAGESVTEYKTKFEVQKEKCLDLFIKLDESDRIKTIERMETYLEDEKYKKGDFSCEVGKMA